MQWCTLHTLLIFNSLNSFHSKFVYFNYLLRWIEANSTVIISHHTRLIFQNGVICMERGKMQMKCPQFMKYFLSYSHGNSWWYIFHRKYVIIGRHVQLFRIKLVLCLTIIVFLSLNSRLRNDHLVNKHIIYINPVCIFLCLILLLLLTVLIAIIKLVNSMMPFIRWSNKHISPRIWIFNINIISNIGLLVGRHNIFYVWRQWYILYWKWEQ